MSDSNYKIVLGDSAYELEKNVNKELNEKIRVASGGPFMYGSFWAQAIVERKPK